MNARAERTPADARRILQFGGEPDFAPDTLLQRSHAADDASLDLQSMVRATLVAERIAIEGYRQKVKLICDKHPTPRRLLEEVRRDEEEHADEPADMLFD